MPTRKQVADEIVRRLRYYDERSGSPLNPMEFDDIESLDSDTDAIEGLVALVADGEEFFLPVEIA